MGAIRNTTSGNAEIKDPHTPRPPGGVVSINALEITVDRSKNSSGAPKYTYQVVLEFSGPLVRERELILYKWNTGFLGSGVGAYWERAISGRVQDGNATVSLSSEDDRWLLTGWYKEGYPRPELFWNFGRQVSANVSEANAVVEFEDGAGGRAKITVNALPF